MTPKRQAELIRKCHGNARFLQGAIAGGKMIPRLDEIVTIYQLLEEIVKACPVEAG